MFKHFPFWLFGPELAEPCCEPPFPPPPPPFFMMGFKHTFGDRIRRGDIKFILLEMLSKRSMHGYEMIKELESRPGFFRRLSPGSVYPTLQMLEDGGYLTSEQVDGKRVYTITETGQKLLNDFNNKSCGESPMDCYTNEGDSEARVNLKKVLMELTDAVKQVGKAGNSEQEVRVKELLQQTKRDIYKILADS